MPTTNAYYRNDRQLQILRTSTTKIKSFLAEKLTCGDRVLKPDEISIRFIRVEGHGMLGTVEIEITAHAYPERIKKQDQICLEIQAFLQKDYPSLGEVKVWLVLSELGHSWEE